jgi:hypothetical protein
MHALPEQIRVVVYYADFEGRRYSEIAEIMDSPLGTVNSRLHRGRRQLPTLLNDVAEPASATTIRRARSISCNVAKLGTPDPLRAGPDQVKAAVVGQLIGDDLQIAECTVNSRLHSLPRALQLTLQRQPTRSGFDGPGRQRLRDDVCRPSRRCQPRHAT